MSAMFLKLPSESKTATPSFLYSSALVIAVRDRPSRTASSLVPAASPLIPWSAKTARAATPVSSSTPNVFIAVAALFVSAVENCSTEEFANVFALTSTSDSFTMFSRFSAASSLDIPSADCASVNRSVASAMSNIPACANLATAGRAAIEASASRPADARKKYDSAASFAENVVVLATSRAASDISPRSVSDTLPIIASDLFIAESKSANAFTDAIPIPATTAVAAPMALPIPEAKPFRSFSACRNPLGSER